MIEIAVIFRPDAVKRLRRLHARIRYGVKEELIDLVSLRGVGRARARILFDNGIRDRKDVEEADFYTLANLPRIGNALAKSLKIQTNSFVEVPPAPSEPVRTEEKAPEPRKKQPTLFDFE